MAGLRRQGWEIQECHVPLWERERNKTGRYLGGGSLFIRGVQLLWAYVKLIVRYLFAIRGYDVMIVGYIGHVDLLVGWCLTRLPRRPLVFDPLISMYDTLVADRAAFGARSPAARLLWRLDRLTCRLADVVLLDTNAHIEYFVNTFHLPASKFVRVFVGAEEDVFAPRETGSVHEPFRVLFIGKFTPLHGLPVIIEAAHRLRDEPVLFDIVGSGQLSGEIHQRAKQLDLKNVQFTPWVDYERLPDRIAQADVCLGIFGVTDKADRVIPAKVFTALAMRKPLITGDSAAIRELLTDGESVALCRRGDPEALRRVILQVYADATFRERVAEAGYRVYRERASEEQIGRTVAAALVRLLSRGMT